MRTKNKEGETKLADNETPYSDYFEHNRTIASVLSLFAGFLFAAITILLSVLPNKTEILPQVTILFITFLFYLTLFALLDNLEMGFHYIKNIPPMTLKVRPFFNLLVIFYLFGVSTVLMFLLFDLSKLSLISGVIWAIVVILSLATTGRRFIRQARARDWKKQP
jgi:hypothetical protein